MRDLAFRHFDAAGARQIRATVETIYAGSNVDVIARGDPYYTIDAFMRRFDSYARWEGFDLAVAWLDGEPAGQAWGWPLDRARGAGWWEGLIKEPEPGFTAEDGKRTFALSEIMVGRRYTGQHIAHAVHDELLNERHEARATVLVNPADDDAYRVYLRWGWRAVAQLRPPRPGAPLFDVLIQPLPVAF
jgi:hypothetical protein